MALDWYSCRKCNTLLKQDKTPSSSNCSAPKNSAHSWQKLAEVGNTNYRCRKCGMLLQAKTTPSSSNCSAPKNSAHSWQKM